MSQYKLDSTIMKTNSIIYFYGSCFIFIDVNISASFKSISFYLNDKNYKKILSKIMFYTITNTEVEIEYDIDRSIFIDIIKTPNLISSEKYFADFEQSEMEIMSRCSLLSKNKKKYITSSVSHFSGISKSFFISLDKYPNKGFHSYIKYGDIKKWSWIAIRAYKNKKPVKVKLDLENEWLLDLRNANIFDEFLYVITTLFEKLKKSMLPESA